MRHHQHNIGFKFFKQPVDFTKSTDMALLKYCLGAVLYMPGTRNILDKILEGNYPASAIVMCFEDAICEADLAAAEDNVLKHLNVIADALKNGLVQSDVLPLIFVRARSCEQMRIFIGRMTYEQAEILTGFVFPKFDSFNGAKYLDELRQANARFGTLLYGMPILEGRLIAHKETRGKELLKLSRLMRDYYDLILNIRVGATDFSAIFGVRRGINYSIYDIVTVRDCISDILNTFTRSDEGYVLSAPVWEYFLADKQESLDHLLEHDIHRSLLQRSSIVNDAIDGLLREVILDKANGFVGKTIIHPSHLKYVNAMQAVTKEEYEDAMQILDTSGGVVKSAKSNKMNEINPHRSWAQKIAQRAKAYGVVEDEE